MQKEPLETVRLDDAKERKTRHAVMQSRGILAYRESDEELLIVRRDYNLTHVLIACIAVAFTFFVAIDPNGGVGKIAGTIFTGACAYVLLVRILNRRTIHVTQKMLIVSQSPLPWLGAKVSITDLTGIDYFQRSYRGNAWASYYSYFTMFARLKNGSRKTLLSNDASLAVVLFIIHTTIRWLKTHTEVRLRPPRDPIPSMK